MHVLVAERRSREDPDGLGEEVSWAVAGGVRLVLDLVDRR